MSSSQQYEEVFPRLTIVGEISHNDLAPYLSEIQRIYNIIRPEKEEHVIIYRENNRLFLRYSTTVVKLSPSA